MTNNYGTSSNEETLLENFAAELTNAVYPIALRHGMKGSWINMELGLWRVLTETVKKWSREWPSVGSSEEFEVWRQGFLVELTEEAVIIAVRHGIRGLFLEVQLDLYRVFRLVVRRRYRTRESELRYL
jgi:hypothetical protein